MSNIVILPLPKLELKLPLSEYGKGKSATSVLSVAGTVLEELGKIIGKEGD
ncbi:hypothetical protein AnigIFM56816_000499 [Aspergillus niger]|nr:hypothetical protein AnigIFM56816_000499 [Aspergillus niger]